MEKKEFRDVSGLNFWYYKGKGKNIKLDEIKKIIVYIEKG